MRKLPFLPLPQVPKPAQSTHPAVEALRRERAEFIGPSEDDDGWKAAMCRIRGEYSWQQKQVGPATGHSMSMDDDFLHSLEDAGDMDGYDRLMKIILENPATEP
jgi:hypothetical protein